MLPMNEQIYAHPSASENAKRALNKDAWWNVYSRVSGRVDTIVDRQFRQIVRSGMEEILFQWSDLP